MALPWAFLFVNLRTTSEAPGDFPPQAVPGPPTAPQTPLLGLKLERGAHFENLENSGNCVHFRFQNVDFGRNVRAWCSFLSIPSLKCESGVHFCIPHRHIMRKFTYNGAPRRHFICKFTCNGAPMVHLTHKFSYDGASLGDFIRKFTYNGLPKDHLIRKFTCNGTPGDHFMCKCTCSGASKVPPRSPQGSTRVSQYTHYSPVALYTKLALARKKEVAQFLRHFRVPTSNNCANTPSYTHANIQMRCEVILDRRARSRRHAAKRYTRRGREAAEYTSTIYSVSVLIKTIFFQKR